MQNAINVRGLTKDYGQGRGVFDFDFSVQTGEIFGLVGTNGSGKTTTIRAMMGFIKGNSGSVEIFGLDAWKDAAEIKKRVGYVPGQIDFPDVGSGTAFLKLQTEMLDLKDLSYMNSLIDRLKIDITAPLKRMSKGMKQKMAIVAAFMAQPDLYLLDEPSTGLDPLMRDTMVEIILEQKALGKTVFMSSHVFKEMEDTCDTVMFIRDGKIQTTVRRAQYESDPRETYTIYFATPKAYEAYLEKASQSGGCVVIMHKNDHRLSVTATVKILQTNEFLRCLSAYPIAGIEHATYSLEKYYMKNIERAEVHHV